MGIAGAKMAKIFDDSTGEYVDINLISKDSTYEKKGRSETDIDGNLLYVEDEARLIVVFYDGAKAAQLEAWQQNHIKLKMVVIGVEDYIFWNRESTIILTEPAAFDFNQRNVRKLEMQALAENLAVTRLPGYQVYEVVDGYRNLLAGFISTDFNFADGITVMNLLPATFGAEGSVSWKIAGTTYNFNTVILNTQG